MTGKTLRLDSEDQGYLLTPSAPPPPDYPPERSPDQFNSKIFDQSYTSRCEAFLTHLRRNPAPNNQKGPWYELARLSLGAKPHLGIILSAFDEIQQRQEGAELLLHFILRLVYQFGNHVDIDPTLLEQARRVVLDFEYWPESQGINGLTSWTESHYLLCTAAGVLAGELYPDEIFTSFGQTGNALAQINRSRLMRWMNLRFFTGFSEWLSDISYDEQLTGLVNLVEFALDEEIRQRATMLIDLLLLDMSLNQFKGVFGSTHGHSNGDTSKWAENESTTDTFKLLFGTGVFSSTDNSSAIAFALSKSYQLPRVLFEITADPDRAEMLNRQRVGFQVEQAEWWGLNPRKFEDGMLLFNLEGYFHPQLVNLFVKSAKRFNWWEKPLFQPLRSRKGMFNLLSSLRLMPFFARLFEEDLSRTTHEDVNLYTYRTPDYMLSSAQDYRKGLGGYQQHIWQATLGRGAVCFTTHAARYQGPPPNYWTGSGTLPRVAQLKNVLIAIYRIPKSIALWVPNELSLTHAWLPGDQFEEIVEEEGWIFARLGDGYLALLSQFPYEWRTPPGEEQERELIVEKSRNIWICELGRREVNGDFATFIQNQLKAEVRFYDSKVTYHSPTQGRLQFGWKGPLRRDGQVIPIENYPRYGNPYVQVDFPPEELTINLGEHNLYLNWLTGHRQSSSFI